MSESRIYLRALELNDYTELYKWRNNFNVTDLLGGNRFFVSSFREKKWVEDAIINDKTNLHLAICLKEANQIIGLVNLTNIDFRNRKAEFSIMIGDSKQHNKGYGSFAINLMLSHGFEELNLNRIYLTVLSINNKAKEMYENLGFKEEGVLREDIFKNNTYHDLYLMSILKNEYKSQ